VVEFVPGWGWPEELSSWTWPGQESKNLKVRVYTSADRIELRLNGKVAGGKQLTSADRMQAELAVPYAPGTLEVIAYQDGVESGRRQLETAGAPIQIRLTPERAKGNASKQSLHYVRIDVVDAKGRLVPDAMIDIEASVTGPAEIAAFGSANPRAVGSIRSSVAQVYQGQALLILRSTGRKGNLRVRVDGEKLESGEVNIQLK